MKEENIASAASFLFSSSHRCTALPPRRAVSKRQTEAARRVVDVEQEKSEIAAECRTLTSCLVGFGT